MDRKSFTFSAGRVANTTSKRMRITVRLDDVRPSGVLRMLAIGSLLIIIIGILIGSILSTPQKQNGQATKTENPSQQNTPNRRATETGGAATEEEPATKQHTPWIRFINWLIRPSPTDWLLVAISFVGVMAALFTLLTIHAQTRSTHRAAEASMRAAKATQIYAEAVMVAERAYVALAHKKRKNKPDFRLEPKPNTDGSCTLEMQADIMNFGKTPAYPLGALLCHHVGAEGTLPTDVESLYSGSQIDECHGFLVADGAIPVKQTVTVQPHDWTRVQAGERLWILGWVDYSDKLEKRDRGRYARWFDPSKIEGHNLVFEATRGYNDDRQLTAEEEQKYNAQSQKREETRS